MDLSVCIKGLLVERYKTEISAVKVNWSILGNAPIRFSFILGSSDSYFKQISELKVPEISSVFSLANKRRVHLSDLNLKILKRVIHQRHTATGYFNIMKQIMK